MYGGQEGMNIKAKKADVLARLHKNREQHAKIVEEARKGYVEKARKALKARLDDLESGKICDLAFRLATPVNHTRVYDTAIESLTWHTGDEIELTSQQVRNLIMDQWDWTSGFLHTNAAYSAAARSLEPGSHLLDEDEGY